MQVFIGNVDLILLMMNYTMSIFTHETKYGGKFLSAQSQNLNNVLPHASPGEQ